MRKPLWSMVMIVLTVFSAALMLAWSPVEEPVKARIVTVGRGDVHQVVALTGRMAYADEAIVYARTSGRISRLCVEPGGRVGAGEALVRMDAAVQEDAVSAFLANAQALEAAGQTAWVSEQLTMENTVIRADNACTVRQLYVQENAVVAAGTPIARVSSSQQVIHSDAVMEDAEQIIPGMWAWLSSEGEALGFAKVISVGEPEADLLTGLTTAAVRLQPEQHIELPEGAAIDVDVYLAGSDDVLALPVEAITRRGTVWWVCEGRCTEIPAEIVMSDEMLAWVALPEGLAVAIGEFKEGQLVAEADE